jgi:Zn-dependent peptidase ImmA (M78 family)/DNA-binding XRE family transcriptional regulator
VAIQKVNYNMVTLARESRGLTQSELAGELGVTQGKISKIEQGLLSISDQMLIDLSSCLKYPQNFFCLTDAVCAHGINLHRKRAALTKKTLCKIDAHLNIRRIHLHKLLEELEITGDGIPEFSVNRTQTPEVIAHKLRKHWDVPTGPIDNMTSLVEKAGGIVINCDFESQLIDGVSSRGNDLPPMIFVNKDISGDRLRFTLAHELGHLVMHSSPTPDMEDEADQFASEFLMPKKEIESSLRFVNLSKLAELKRYWKVSMAALLVRAGKVGAITSRQSQYLWMQLSKAGYRTKEPAQLDVARETPRLLSNIINYHLSENHLTAEEVSGLIGIHHHEFRRMYLEEQPSVRKVRRTIGVT